MTIRSDLFTYLQDFLLRRSGLVLADSKAYLIRSRVQVLLRKFDIADINTLVMRIKRQETGEIAKALIDEMTTNETLFFRDNYPFEALKKLIFPALNDAGGMHSQVKIWSAASSRGQEPYSIAMTAAEALPNAAQRVKILATDLSKQAIDYAKAGIYSQMEVKRGLSEKQLSRFFSKQGETWQVRPDLKRMMVFQEANLVDDAVVTRARSYGPFDIVFCRNVLIYFSPEERKNVIDRLAKTMKPHGYLLTGAADRVEGHVSQWESTMFQGKRIWQLQ